MSTKNIPITFFVTFFVGALFWYIHYLTPHHHNIFWLHQYDQIIFWQFNQPIHWSQFDGTVKAYHQYCQWQHYLCTIMPFQDFNSIIKRIHTLIVTSSERLYILLQQQQNLTAISEQSPYRQEPYFEWIHLLNVGKHDQYLSQEVKQYLRNSSDKLADYRSQFNCINNNLSRCLRGDIARIQWIINYDKLNNHQKALTIFEQLTGYKDLPTIRYVMPAIVYSHQGDHKKSAEQRYSYSLHNWDILSQRSYRQRAYAEVQMFVISEFKQLFSWQDSFVIDRSTQDRLYQAINQQNNRCQTPDNDDIIICLIWEEQKKIWLITEQILISPFGTGDKFWRNADEQRFVIMRR
jgi:hypothetical protein